MAEGDRIAQPRRLGVEGSKVRERFVDAAQAILSEEGSHGISARLVAAKAGLKTQLLYYYFRTMDDLLLAVVRRVNERRSARFEEALAAPQPLRALWRLNSDPAAAVLATELTAIAGHREAVRAEIVASARDFRRRQIEALERLLPAGLGDKFGSAAGVMMIAAALGRVLVTETALGLAEGHAEALAIVEHMLDRLEPAGGEGTK
jgi:AcrR family transcriptional regulator